MDIVTVRSGKKEYLYIARNHRVNGLEKRETIYCLGSLQELSRIEDPSSFFRKEIKAIDEFNARKRAEETIPLAEAEPLKNLGVIYIRYALKKLGLISFLKKKQKESHVHYSYVDAFTAYVCSKIIDPGSLRSSWLNQSLFFNQFECSMDQLYRFLDKVCDFGQEMEAVLYKHYEDLYPYEKMRHIYYDGTNFWFETSAPDPDIYDEDGNLVAHGLRSKGFSKENKRDPIVNIGLMAADQGFPIDTEFFPGKEKEVARLPGMIRQLREDYDIPVFTLEADRGNYSGNIIHEIEEDHDYYIIGIPVRIADGNFKYWAINPDGYTYFLYRRISGEQAGFNEKSRIVEKRIKYEDDGHKRSQKVTQLQLVYKSEVYARKEEYKRQEDLVKAMDLLKNPSKYKAKSRTGAGKYVVASHVTEYGEKAEGLELNIDQQAVEQSRLLDGIYGIASNDIDLYPVKLFQSYRQLLYCENDFRVLKSDLELRPAYVWTEDHLFGYLFLSIVSLAVLRYLERLLGGRYSPEQIQESLKSFFCIKTDQEDYQIPSTNTIIEALRAKTGVGFDHRYNTKRDILRVLAWKNL